MNSTMLYRFDNRPDSIQDEYVVIKTSKFYVSNRKLAISILKIRVQVSFTIINYECLITTCIITSNNNGYDMSMDISILIHCFNIGLVFKHARQNGNIVIHLNNLKNYGVSDSNIFIARDDIECTNKLDIHSIGVQSKSLCSICNVHMKFIIYPPESIFYDSDIFISIIFMNDTASIICKSLKFIEIITHLHNSTLSACITSYLFKTIDILNTNLANLYLLIITQCAKLI